MRKFQEFLESKSLKLQETHEPGHYDTDDDPTFPRPDVIQSLGREGASIKKLSAHQDAFKKIRELAKEYIGHHDIDPSTGTMGIKLIIHLIDEILDPSRRDSSPHPGE